jgi:ABC-type oligopeptide transport system substrate-binding subunit
MLELWWLGWIPDYNDSSNFINPLMTNKAIGSNMAKIDNAELQTLMEDAVQELDSTVRAGMYKDIQQLFIEEIYGWILGYQSRSNSHTAINVRGYYPNPFEDPMCKYLYFV